jgi:hypothetical protein
MSGASYDYYLFAICGSFLYFYNLLQRHSGHSGQTGYPIHLEIIENESIYSLFRTKWFTYNY